MFSLHHDPQLRHATRTSIKGWVLKLALILAVLALSSGSFAFENEIIAWGSNLHGQCDVPEPEPDFVMVAAGSSYSAGLTREGSIIGWGQNEEGQCEAPVPNADFVAVACGSAHTMGLKEDGSIVAWGRNSYGQCDIPEPNEGFVAIAAGWGHSLGLKEDGSIVVWGYDWYGLQEVPEPNSGFVALAVGTTYHNLALKDDGSIVAWGLNDYGQCDVPEPNTGFIAVDGGNRHSLGLRNDGSIVGWGAGGEGQTGEYDYGQLEVPEPNEGFAKIAGGAYHSAGLLEDGSFVAWGRSDLDASTLPSPNWGFTSLIAGAHHNLALRPTWSGSVAVLVTDSGNLDDYDNGFLDVCSPLFTHDLVGLNDLNGGNVALTDYDVVVCAAKGTLSQLAGFTDPEIISQIQAASAAGTDFVLAGGGSLVAEALGLGDAIETPWSPIYNDSWYMVERNYFHPLLDGVATLDDWQDYSLAELNALEDPSLIWRVRNPYSGSFTLLNLGTISPTLYLGERIRTGHNITDPYPTEPYWDLGAGRVVYLQLMFWTTDNPVPSKGQIGTAGLKMLDNAVDYFLRPTPEVAVLIADSSAPTTYDTGFLDVCAPLFDHEVIGVNDVLDGFGSLADYRVVVCAAKGTEVELAQFASPGMVSAVQQSTDQGTHYVLAGGGAMVLEALGLGDAIETTWNPIYEDSWFMVEKTFDHPILEGVSVLDNWTEYSRDELNNLSSPAMLWRVKHPFSGSFMLLNLATISPDLYLGQRVRTGFDVTDPYPTAPFWELPASRLVYLQLMFWTTDNGVPAMGHIGEAGLLMLENAVTAFLAGETSGVESEGMEIPTRFAVEAFPNPFNPMVNFEFATTQTGPVTAEVYSLRGERVKTLVSEWKAGGSHRIVWDGTDDNNRNMGSGIYLFRVKTVEGTATSRVTLIK